MSNFGIFIYDPSVDETPRRPKSKAEIKRTLPKFIYVEKTSAFNDGRFKYNTMPLLDLPCDSYLFVGPDPYNSRKFYGTIVLAENGQVFVR